MTALLDEVGNEVREGDTFTLSHIDASRGAREYLTLQRLLVVEIKRSRILVLAPNHSGQFSVGPECGRVVMSGDRRPLRTWDDVHAEQRKARQAERATQVAGLVTAIEAVQAVMDTTVDSEVYRQAHETRATLRSLVESLGGRISLPEGV